MSRVDTQAGFGWVALGTECLVFSGLSLVGSTVPKVSSFYEN